MLQIFDLIGDDLTIGADDDVERHVTNSECTSQVTSPDTLVAQIRERHPQAAKRAPLANRFHASRLQRGPSAYQSPNRVKVKPEITGFYELAVDLMNNRVSNETERNRSLFVGLHANWEIGRRETLSFP